MKAVILSGGQGLRLRPLTDDRPKPLIHVGDRPIAEVQIDWLLKSGEIDGIVFACGYKWERLKEHFGSNHKGLSVDYSVEDAPLGTGGAIKKAMSLLGGEEQVVVLNGDIITDLPLKRMIQAHMAGVDVAASMLVVPYRSRFGVVKIDKLKMVRGFEEKPAFPDVWINGGVYIVSAKKTARYLPDSGDIERESFPMMVERGELMSYPYYGDWWYIDSVKDLKEVEVMLKSSR